MAAAALAATSNSFLILGHGEEEIVDFEDRPTLDDSYTLVTIEECGIVTTRKDVCPLVEAFSKEENKDIFADPIAHKSEIEGFMGGKGLHIYTSGMKYPKLSIQFFLDWPTPERTEIMKSGTYKFPLDAAAFEIGPGASFQEKMFKFIGPYTPVFEELPDDYNAEEMYGGSIYPILEKVHEYLARTKRVKGLKFGFPLENAMKKGGPGVYYYVVCRSPKLVKSPRDLVEAILLDGEHEAKYRPYYGLNWVSNINSIIPLMQANHNRITSTWMRTELQDTINDYRRLQRVPLIRQASVNQQRRFAPAESGAAAAGAAASSTRRRKSRNRKARRRSTRRNR